MISIFYYSNELEEEEKIKKILFASGVKEYQLFNIVNYDSELILKEKKIRNVITFGKIARKSLGEVDIDNLIEFPTADEVGRFSAIKKKEVIKEIEQLSEKAKEFTEHENLNRIEVESLSVDKEKILALIAEKGKNKKYIAYLKDKRTTIEISDKRELSGSIHMTLEDLFVILVMKDVLGATIVEIKKGEDNV